MVPRPSRPVSGGPSEVARAGGSVTSASLPSVSPQPFQAKASCLETLQRAAGFSKGVALQLTRARRRSSQLAYQAMWGVYRSWCAAKQHTVSNPSIPKIAEFLLWLWRVKKFALPTIKAYRSMLSSVFYFQGIGIGSNSTLRSLIRSFSLERPKGPPSPPSWDLSKVLSFLLSDKFEPLEQKSLRVITQVLFLVALATSKRVGEIQALSRKVS